MPSIGAVCTCGGAMSVSLRPMMTTATPKQAREAWFGKLIEDGLMPAGNIHEMPADGRDADEIASASSEQTDAVLAAAAAEYQRELVEQLGSEPALDIAMFGVGPDAHFASCSPTMAKSKSTIRMCWWPACVIRRNRRRCV